MEITAVFVILCFRAAQIYSQGIHEGDNCALRNGDDGVCKLIGRCAIAVRALRNGQQPRICGIRGAMPVVCCPYDDDAENKFPSDEREEGSGVTTTTTTTPTPTTTMTTVTARTTTTTWTATTAKIPHKISIIDGSDDVPASNATGNTAVNVTTTTATTDLDYSSSFTNTSKRVQSAKIPGKAKGNGGKSGAFRVESKSVFMCHKYAQHTYYEVEVAPQLIGEKPTIKRTPKCESASTLIVGGVKAKPKEFPHMALIGYGTKLQTVDWLCGGSLISEKYVLSAAHCVQVKMLEAKWVRLGDLDVESNKEESGPLTVEIAKVIPHPDYKKSELYNDLALFLLRTDVIFSPYVLPLCLNTDKSYQPYRLTATGWGLTREGGTRSSVLMKVAIRIVDTQKCNSSFGENVGSRLQYGIVSNSQICAGEVEGGKDTCQGDSGGPLQEISRFHPCMYTIFGITSFGRKCAVPDSPGVYTRVDHYVPWIESIVWP